MKTVNSVKKSRRVTAAVYIIIRVITVAVLAYSLARGQWENAVTCALTLGLLLIPSFLERKMQIALPGIMEVMMISFVFAANIMGEISAFYEKIPQLDTALHAINGFICAGVGFGLINILNRTHRVRLSPLFVVLFSFCFSMTAGTVWEFFEFGMDLFFGKDMQKDTLITSVHSHLLSGDGGVMDITDIRDTAVNGQSLGIKGYLDIGLYDTMKDLMVNFVGAAVFNTAGYFYLIGRKKHTEFIRNFIPEKIEKPEPTNDPPLIKHLY